MTGMCSNSAGAPFPMSAVRGCTLIALLQELSQLSRRAIASLVGVAPFGRAISGAAAPPVGEVLYTAALVAKRYNPLIAFAKRLAGAR